MKVYVVYLMVIVLQQIEALVTYYMENFMRVNPAVLSVKIVGKEEHAHLRPGVQSHLVLDRLLRVPRAIRIVLDQHIDVFIEELGFMQFQ